MYLDECEGTLDEGRSYGLSGPVLLDWFYMAQRLPYRSGLGARSGRSSACVAPAFVRGAFDLRPKDRLSARPHREVVAQLVPDWAPVDFFRSDSEEMPEIHRARIWERPDEARVVEEVIAARDAWPDMLVASRIEEMWREVPLWNRLCGLRARLLQAPVASRLRAAFAAAHRAGLRPSAPAPG
jgi:hypothetical protein